MAFGGHPSCAQHFVSVFTETIDWHAGDDAQFWSVLPITAPEEARLVEQQSSVTENILDALGPGRRCLRVDHPSGGEKEIYWGTGLFVLFHD